MAGVYTKYKSEFLNKVTGAEPDSLLIRDEYVQVFHGFSSKENAVANLENGLFV